MKIIQSVRDKLQGLIQAMSRYPLTALFLIALAIVNAITIQNDMKDYSHYMFTFIIGAVVAAVAEHVWERFFNNMTARLLLMVAAVVLSGLYYAVMHTSTVFNMENGTKTTVMLFALSMAFIWIPTIKNQTVTFNESFMSTFKAFFLTILFSAVIVSGVSAIILAIDSLLFNIISNKIMFHAMNIIYSLFTPIFFLSFTPYYEGKRYSTLSDEQQLYVKKATSSPKQLEVLISYIVIPLVAIYTLILVAYVALNIRGDFWTNNLLEPLLVSYAVTVILVYVLASHMENKFATMFRKVFPKVLIPIVLFQTVASALKIQEVGVTHDRYYAILFGVFAVIAGIIFSVMNVRKNGIIAAVLIVLSIISITPPVDAFTVSRVNQIKVLQETLVKNNMFEDNKIIPNDNISDEDKRLITRTMLYLDGLNYTKNVDWLPEKIFYYGNFKKVFGFDELYDEVDRGGESNKFVYFDWERNPVVEISGYDVMVQMYMNSPTKDMETNQKIPFTYNGKDYILHKQLDGNHYNVFVKDGNDVLITVNSKDVFDQIFEGYEELPEGKGNTLTYEQASVIRETDKVRIRFIVLDAGQYDRQYNGNFYVYVDFK